MVVADQPDELDRPATVTAACVLTWISSFFTMLMGGLVIYGLLEDRDGFIDRLSEEGDLNGMSADDVFLVLVVIAGVFMVWCVVAMVLAIAAFRRSRSARILLLVSSVLVALLSLPGVLVIYPVLTLICAVAVASMLASRSAKEWYAATT